MIDKVHIKALKSIKDLMVQCSHLNLLVGTNSSGKSTFIQALLLLAQEELNGRLISLGEFREVRNYSMGSEAIKIELWEKGKENPAWIECKEDKGKDGYTIQSSLKDEVLLEIAGLESLDEKQSIGIMESYGLHYLSCHRIGAKDIYEKNMLDESNFGIDGEYTLSYLLKHESDSIAEELIKNDSNTTNSLLDQVNYWLDYIVGTTLAITDLKKTNYLQVKYNNNPSNASSEALYCRPINVGSGISYLISIIISCLGSEKDEVIIIENPEIHLHPKAQSRLSDFFYFVSKAQRQLFIETHSDHIFNGLRVGVATGKIAQEDISINFFAMNDQYETQCNPIIFEDYGRIVGTNEDMDINDLFDQFEIDLDKMLGL